MKWFEGGIAEAISAAKLQGAVFVVYCEGEIELHENSKLDCHSGDF